MDEHIIIYTDGGCHGNPGPGGWGFVLECDGKRIERRGGEKHTTNNKMELEAVISALSLVAETPELSGRRIEIHTDSQYVKNGISSWIHSWMKKGWKTAAGKPVKNQEYWKRLKELDDRVNASWNWVKGHAGNELNERCDALVQEAIADL